MVVLVSTSDASASRNREMTRALEEALEPGSVVLLRETSRPVDEDLAAVLAAARADTIAVVTWSETEGLRAHLRVQRANGGSPTERDLDFKPSDAPADRDRTIGFALAAMLPLAGAPPPATPPPAESASPTTPDAPLDVREATRQRPWALEVAFATSIGLGASAYGFGIDLALQRRLTTTLDIRLAAGFTRGPLPAADATLTAVRPRVGVGALAFARGPLALGLRVEGGPWFHGVERSAPPSSGSRWVFALSPNAELVWSASTLTAGFLGLGADIVTGTTRVFVGDEARGVIPPVRLVATAGGRFSF